MVNIATVGTSEITRLFIREGQKLESFNLCAVYSRTESKASEFAEEFGAQKYYTSLKLMSEDDSIDAVYIASPNSLHASQAKLFLSEGKHVLCEKPVCSNSGELHEVLECAEENEVLFMEAFKTFSAPNYQKLKQLLPKVGQIRSVYFDFARYSSRYDAHKRGEDVNTFKAAFSNGAVMDMGVYSIYPILDLFGFPKDIKAMGTVIPDGVDGEGMVLMKYDGFTAAAHFSKTATSHAISRIEGEDATLLIDSIYTPMQVRVVSRNGNIKTYDYDKKGNGMRFEIEEFLHCVENGILQSQVHSHRLSRYGMRVLDAARRQMGVVYPADDRI